MKEGRDLWWDEIVDGQPDTFEPAELGAEEMLLHPLYVGDDGQAKGDSPHPGAVTWSALATTHHYVFDLKPDDVIGAQPTSAGGQGTATSSTAHCAMVPPG